LNSIELDKQTKRKSFMNLKTESQEEYDNYYNSSKKHFFSEKTNEKTNSFIKSKTASNFPMIKSLPNSDGNSLHRDMYSKSNGLMNSNEEVNAFYYSSNNFDQKRETATSFNKPYKTSYSSFPSMKKNSKKWMKLQAPDFKRMGFRENKDLKSDKKRIIPFGLPSFQAVMESTVLSNSIKN